MTHEITLEVVMLVVDSIIYHCNIDSVACDAELFPHRGDIHHMLREVLINEMPLIRKYRISDAKA